MEVAVVFVTVLLLSLRLSCLAEDCGKRPPFRKRRVIGGHEAKAHSWPWQAEIQAKRDGKWYHKCGASLINPQWIVTAAHCLTIHADRKMRIVLGEHDRTKSEGTEQYFDISQWCIHGRFDVDLDESYGYDIGLIKLSRSAIMDKTVGLICLPKQNERVPVGKLCYLTGWGAYEPGGVDRAETLQEVQIPTVNYSICSKGNSHFQSVDNESMLCAGFGGNSTVSGCSGDSGGPLSCPEGGKFVLRGAVSWGIPKCPAGNTFSVFARISAFVDWIENRVNNSVECSCAVKGVEWAFAHRLKIILMLGLAYLFKY